MGKEVSIRLSMVVSDNDEKDILVYFDKDIVSEDIMTFHPNTNEKTIFIKSKDLFRFLESIGFTYKFLTLR